MILNLLIPMQLHRIFAVFLRHWYAILGNPERWMEMFYWPLFDLLLWGITGTTVQLQLTGNNKMGLMIVLGMLLWLILQRTQHEVSMSFLTDMWDGNLVNLFISPLAFSEWFFAVAVMSLFKMLTSFLFAGIVALILYQVNVFTLGVGLVPIILLLLLFSWSISAVNVSVLFLFGSKAQTISWLIIAFITPFSAVYYEVNALPDWARFIGLFLPTSYAFEAMRSLFHWGMFNRIALVNGFILATIYATLTLWFLRYSINLSLQRGLFKNK